MDLAATDEISPERLECGKIDDQIYGQAVNKAVSNGSLEGEPDEDIRGGEGKRDISDRVFLCTKVSNKGSYW